MTVPKVKPIILMPFLDEKSSLVVLLKRIESLNLDVEIVVVNDGSIEDQISNTFLETFRLNIYVIHLKRNSGPQSALATGINYIQQYLNFAFIILMDSDGEDVPDSLPPLIKMHVENSKNFDITVVERLSRENSWTFKILWNCYKLLFLVLTGKSMNFGHFSILSRRAVDRLVNYPQLWIHLGATYYLTKLRIGRISLPRGRRFAGESKTGLSTLINHGIRSLIALKEFLIPRVLIALFLFELALMMFLVVLLLFKITKFLLLVALIQISISLILLSIILAMNLITQRSLNENQSSNDFENLIAFVTKKGYIREKESQD